MVLVILPTHHFAFFRFLSKLACVVMSSRLIACFSMRLRSRLLRLTLAPRPHSIFFSCSIHSGTSHPLSFIKFAIDRSIGFDSLPLPTLTLSSSVNSVIAVPLRPARPVRPTR